MTDVTLCMRIARVDVDGCAQSVQGGRRDAGPRHKRSPSFVR